MLKGSKSKVSPPQLLATNVDSVATDAVLHNIAEDVCSSGVFPPMPLTSDAKDNIMRDYCADMHPSKIQETGCAVCGELKLAAECTPLQDTQHSFDYLMQTGFVPPPAHANRTVKNVLLAPKCTMVCKECQKCASKQKVPKNSIANGMWLGDVPPELQDLTWAEKILVSKVRCNRYFVRVAAGRKKLSANIIAFENPTAKIYNALPPPKEELSEVLAVLMVGPVKPTDDDFRHFRLLPTRGQLG